MRNVFILLILHSSIIQAEEIPFMGSYIGSGILIDSKGHEHAIESRLTIDHKSYKASAKTLGEKSDKFELEGMYHGEDFLDIHIPMHLSDSKVYIPTGHGYCTEEYCTYLSAITPFYEFVEMLMRIDETQIRAIGYSMDLKGERSWDITYDILEDDSES